MLTQDSSQGTCQKFRRWASVSSLLVGMLLERRSHRGSTISRRQGSYAGSNVWALLGLPPGAEKDDIKKQFKRFVRTQHPDVAGNDSPQAKERFNQVMDAYKLIMETDEDRFWLESVCAKVEAYEAAQRERWEKRRERMRQQRLYKLRMEGRAEELAEEQQVNMEGYSISRSFYGAPVDDKLRRAAPAAETRTRAEDDAGSSGTAKGAAGKQATETDNGGTVILSIFAAIALFLLCSIVAIVMTPQTSSKSKWNCVTRNYCKQVSE